MDPVERTTLTDISMASEAGPADVRTGGHDVCAEALERLTLYLKLANMPDTVSPDVAAQQLLDEVTPGECDWSREGAMAEKVEAAIALTQQRLATAMQPPVPPQQPGAMPRQQFGKLFPLFRAGFWHNLFRQVRTIYRIARHKIEEVG